MTTNDGECIIKTRTILTGAATLIAALAWNEVAKSIAECLFAGDGVMTKKRKLGVGVAYAILITIVILLIIEIYNILADKGVIDPNSYEGLISHSTRKFIRRSP
jgi:hypothetical protein